jgi:hypothetical protein
MGDTICIFQGCKVVRRLVDDVTRAIHDAHDLALVQKVDVLLARAVLGVAVRARTVVAEHIALACLQLGHDTVVGVILQSECLWALHRAEVSGPLLPESG